MADSVLGAVVDKWSNTPQLMAYTPNQTTSTGATVVGGLWVGQIPEEVAVEVGKCLAVVEHVSEVPDWTTETAYGELTTIRIWIYALGLSLCDTIMGIVKQTYDWWKIDTFTGGTRQVYFQRTNRQIGPEEIRHPTGEILFHDMVEYQVLVERG